MRILIIGVLAVVVAIGGWIAINKGYSSQSSVTDISVKTEEVLPAADSETTQSQETPQSLEVFYTSESFSPSSLEINAGDTITFINKSNFPMWVASNPHPIHTNLSELDNRKSVANGGTYKFTFEVVGEYSYHNHLNSGDGGTIIVK